MATPYDHLSRMILRRQGVGERWLETSVGAVHAYEARGQGELPPVALLHGFSSSAGHFEALFRRLRRRVRRLIAIDLPAHGFSQSPPRGLNYETIRDGTFEALDQLLPFGESACLVGNSMGGFAAVRYTNARPERVRGLVLLSPGGAAMAPPDLGKLRSLFEMTRVDEALDFVDRLLAQRHPLRKLIAPFVLKEIRRDPLQSLIKNLHTRHLLRPEELAGLAVPVLFVWGGRDRILPEASKRWFIRHLPPEVRIETPPHFGHTPQLEVPEEVARMMLSFIEGLEAQVKVFSFPDAAQTRRAS
ncbi:MAG: alpha/beta fold hydrolase [Myxococcota bacterium]